MFPVAPICLLAPLLAVVLSLSACRGETPATTFGDGPIEIGMDDFRFTPQVVAARPGEITVRAVNGGRLPHALRVMQGERELLRIGTLLPGEEGEATATLRPGGYRLLCPIANHEELGMYGQLTVRP